MLKIIILKRCGIFKKFSGCYLLISFSLLQPIQNTYNVSEYKSQKGIWILEDKNHKIDTHQIQGIIKFSHNSIIFKGFNNTDEQQEYFLEINPLMLNSSQYQRGIGNIHIEWDNSLIQCKKEFIVAISVDNNTKAVNYIQLIVILYSSNHELPRCNQLLKFTKKASNEENQLQIIINESLALIFFIYEFALALMFRKFILRIKMKLSQVTHEIFLAVFYSIIIQIGDIVVYISIHYGILVDLFQLLYTSRYIDNLYLILFCVGQSCHGFFYRKGYEFFNFKKLSSGKNAVFLVQIFEQNLVIQLLAIIINILITILSVELQFFQLSYAFVLFPQIIHNIRWNSIENFNLFYLFGYLSSGLLFQTYLQFYYVQSNFIEFDYLFIILFYCIYLISVLLLYLQYKYGSRCILPKWILNKYYQDCAICLDCIVIADMENQLLQAPVVLTQCKHKFHEKCLRKWLQEKEDCPLCRTKLDEMN